MPGTRSQKRAKSTVSKHSDSKATAAETVDKGKNSARDNSSSAKTKATGKAKATKEEPKPKNRNLKSTGKKRTVAEMTQKDEAPKATSKKVTEK